MRNHEEMVAACQVVAVFDVAGDGNDADGDADATAATLHFCFVTGFETGGGSAPPADRRQKRPLGYSIAYILVCTT